MKKLFVFCCMLIAVLAYSPAKNAHVANSMKQKKFVEWVGTWTDTITWHTFNFYYNTNLHSINWNNATVDAELPGDHDCSYISGTYGQDLDDGPALIIDPDYGTSPLVFSYPGGTFSIPASTRIVCSVYN